MFGLSATWLTHQPRVRCSSPPPRGTAAHTCVMLSASASAVSRQGAPTYPAANAWGLRIPPCGYIYTYTKTPASKAARAQTDFLTFSPPFALLSYSQVA